MRALVEEAVALEDKLFQSWKAEDAHRLEDIWLELKAPYAHLYSRHLGDTVGAGWWEDLLDAYSKVSVLMEQHQNYRFHVKQVKEKFGTIRFYYHIQALGEETDQWPLPADQVRDTISQQVQDIVDCLETATANRCEVCGQPGQRRSNGWVKTLCDKHDAVQRERNKERFR